MRASMRSSSSPIPETQRSRAPRRAWTSASGITEPRACPRPSGGSSCASCGPSGRAARRSPPWRRKISLRGTWNRIPDPRNRASSHARGSRAYGGSPERLLGDLLAGSNLIDPQEARVELRPTREPASGETLLSLACRGPLAEWSLDLHLRGADPLAVAAARQVSLRIGITCLVIGLSLVLAGIVASLIGRQVRLSRLKSDWTATVAHELRTPLAGMRALVETLIDGRYRSQEQAQEYVRLIAKENERLTRLVENFLSFSRMERRKVVFERSRIDPRQVVDRAAALVSGKFTANGHRFSVEVSGNPPEVFADADALVTVLLNLLENAFKYSGSEKVIDLRCGARGGRVRFEVEDNGTGIPAHARRRIFDRFYQVDRRLSRGTSGCGLGLSIVKYIVEAHGGVVRVESEPGSGSRFTVEFDAVPGREAPAAPAGERTDGA